MDNNSNVKKLIYEIRDEFFKRLLAKTGWGRNDIKEVYNDSLIFILSDKVEGEVK